MWALVFRTDRKERCRADTFGKNPHLEPFVYLGGVSGKLKVIKTERKLTSTTCAQVYVCSGRSVLAFDGSGRLEWSVALPGTAQCQTLVAPFLDSAGNVSAT